MNNLILCEEFYEVIPTFVVAPAAIGLLAPLSATASDVNLDAISNYSEDNLEIDGNSLSNHLPIISSFGWRGFS